MQISKNVYVNIKIKDLDVGDFLRPEDLVDLQVIETAGTSLPIVYAAFLTAEQRIINHFIRNNTVIVELGESPENCDTFNVSIYSNTPPNNGAEGQRRLVEFGGFIINQDYMVNFETKTYFGNSFLVAQRVLYDYFGIKQGVGFQTSITRTNENQVRWRQNNQTPCLFLAETLIHMDIMPSFPLFAFDKYGTFHLNDYNVVAKGEPKLKFVSSNPKETNEVQYINNFSVEDFKDMYNLYSGYNKITEIWGASKGVVQYAKSYNEPILASTRETDMVQSSSRTAINTVQSANVHDTYVEAFVYNSNKLVGLSSMQGAIELVGRYFKELKPTDLVNVTTGDADLSVDGAYLIDTIRTQVDMQRGGILHTYVYVTRDNKNNVENYVANQQKGLKIRKKLFADLLNAIGRVRVAYAMSKKIMDGTFMSQMMSFALITKRNLLRSFNIAGVAIDFNSSANLMKSLIAAGNALMNTLTSMIFPENIAGIFRDFIIRKPSLKSLLYNYVAIYVPTEVRDLITTLLDSLFDTTDTLNSIAKDNKITVNAGAVSGSSDTNDGSHILTTEEGEIVINTDTSEIDYVAESQEKVSNIIKDFEKNTTGLNIPFPIITLTESQALLPEGAMKTYVAQETVKNLTNLGYLDPADADEFEQILLGEREIDFELIDKINKNAGDTYNYKFWGIFGQDNGNDSTFYAWKAEDNLIYTTTATVTDKTILYNPNRTEYIGNDFYIGLDKGQYVIMYNNGGEDVEAEREPSKDLKANNLLELTSFYIKKCYKDKYRTIPCTKLINATNNAKIFFACPTKESDLRFYINSTRVDVVDDPEAPEYAGRQVIGHFPINLGYTDIYGTPIEYTVYYVANKGFNSTSVLFEVKQGGMV